MESNGLIQNDDEASTIFSLVNLWSDIPIYTGNQIQSKHTISYG